ncbi:MAG: hypothetical protein O7D91_19180 [Planctomycetota bacterium]|nr:hypothetical protein [Planctomycetota bacterium]
MKTCAYFTVLSLALAVTGCTADTDAIDTFSHRRFENTTRQAVFQAAEATMSEYFRVDVADHRTGVIRSVPTVVPSTSEDRPLGRRLSSPRQVRKIAEIRIEPLDSIIVVRCGVLVQHSEPTRSLAYAPQRSIDDLPNQTPLQESEGRDDQNNLAWSAAGYDHKLEREMLAAIAERQAQQINN